MHAGTLSRDQNAPYLALHGRERRPSAAGNRRPRARHPRRRCRRRLLAQRMQHSSHSCGCCRPSTPASCKFEHALTAAWSCVHCEHVLVCAPMRMSTELSTHQECHATAHEKTMSCACVHARVFHDQITKGHPHTACTCTAPGQCTNAASGPASLFGLITRPPSSYSLPYMHAHSHTCTHAHAYASTQLHTQHTHAQTHKQTHTTPFGRHAGRPRSRPVEADRPLGPQEAPGALPPPPLPSPPAAAPPRWLLPTPGSGLE